MKRLPIILLPVVAVLAAVLVFGAGNSDVARADGPLEAGHDLFQTEFADLHFTNVPIPPDMFFPGSDPFGGVVEFEGVPIGYFDGFGPLGNTDTIVRRNEDTVPPYPDEIEIEIVRLELTSVAPITIDPGGTLWDVTAQVLEGDVEQTTGNMTIDHQYPNGGTFDTFVLPINPRMTFTEVGGGGVVGPFYLSDVGFPKFELQSTDSPWCHEPKTDCVGFPDLLHIPGLTGPNFYPSGLVEEEHLLPWYPSRHDARPVLTPTGGGGIVELLTGGSDAPASASDGSGGLFTYAAVAAAGAFVLAAGGWYVWRRRGHSPL